MKTHLRRTTLRSPFAILFLVLTTSSLPAQNALGDKARGEVFGGYSAVDDTIALEGWDASAFFFLTDWLALGFDVSGQGEETKFHTSAGRLLLLEEDRDAHHFLFGGHFPLRYKRFTAFGRLMAGAARIDVERTPFVDFPPALALEISDTDFVLSTGGGIDILLRHPFSLRIFQYDYIIDPGADSDFRFSTGIVFSF